MLKKSEKIGLYISSAGVIVAVLTWLFPISEMPSPPEFSASPSPNLIEETLPDAELSVSGTGAEVEIKKNNERIRYEGGAVTTTNGNLVVYLPIGQMLKVNLSGTNARVIVASELMPYIKANNTATGGKIIER